MFGEPKRAEQYPMPQRGGDYFWEVSKEEAVAAVSSTAEAPSTISPPSRHHCALGRRDLGNLPLLMFFRRINLPFLLAQRGCQFH